MQILIVDDEMYSVMGIKDAINWAELGVSAGYDAYNMREAIKIFKEQEIHVMISDIEMPKGTGIELLEWVNEYSPHTETIFLTAHDDFRFMQRAVQLSSFDYMMKPVEYEALEEVIRKAIRTVEKMEVWGTWLIQIVHRCLYQEVSVIPRLRAYIADHLRENITREMLAEYVHLNPAYLSRLFKKVGMSITDYLLNERMQIAKELIVHSTIPISDIAQTIGYSNFSYFSKMCLSQLKY